MRPETPPAREPLFNAPWPAVAIPVLLVAVYLWQWRLASDTEVALLALSPQAIAQGRYQTLLSYLFVHGSWAHVAMNSAAAFAFGPPVARFLGADLRGVLLFYGFFLLCGILSGLGYVIPHWGGSDLAVGASGAISGLWGAASRLLIGRGRLAPVFNRAVILQGVVFIVMNVVVGLLGGLAALNIAWEAHVAGYLVGLILIGPVGRLARSRDGDLPSRHF
jgi:membrane associated rhomboid family serine protease